MIIEKFIYHVSNPMFRSEILSIGLIPKGKSETWMSNTPNIGKVIFATNSSKRKDWFNSTWDDDIYKIDTSKLKNKWYKDPNFSEEEFHIYTNEPIPVEAIELIHKGTGKSKL
jgi:hypothetical protein